MLIELLVTFIILTVIIHIQKRSRLPGGPFSLPVIGTVDLFIKSENPVKQFFLERHYKKYEDFCSFFLGPVGVLIVINDFKICKELFGKAEFSGK